MSEGAVSQSVELKLASGGHFKIDGPMKERSERKPYIQIWTRASGLSVIFESDNPKTFAALQKLKEAMIEDGAEVEELPKLLRV